MSWQKRIFLVVILLALLIPVSPVKAESITINNWKGTVNYQRIQKAYSSAPGMGDWVDEVRLREYFNRKITAVGNLYGGDVGYAYEVIDYIYEYTWDRDCVNYDPWGYYKDTAYIIKELAVPGGSYRSGYKPFSVGFIEDYYALIVFEQDNFQIHQVYYPGCGAPIEEQYYLTTVGGSWYVDDDSPGDVSYNLDHILGYMDEGSYYNDYGNGNFDSNTVTTTFNLTTAEEENVWIPIGIKTEMQEMSGVYTDAGIVVGFGAGVCAFVPPCTPAAPAIALGAAGAEVQGLALDYLSKDPPDPNYTEIILPVTPTTSLQPLLPNGDLTQAQADAFNDLIENEEESIGLARAILTSLDRASGAHLANDNYWVNQQLEAAKEYSRQLAVLLEAQPLLLQNLHQALMTFPGMPFDITSRDLEQIRQNLVANGLSAEQDQLLTELGVDQRGKMEILMGFIQADIQGGSIGNDTIAQFPDVLISPAMIESILGFADALQVFADGQGWTVFLPVTIR